MAWDCATGNGQVASILKDQFKKVKATDISASQLSHAIHAPNIEYRISSAEETSFYDHSFDLITVGQAIHWFDFEAFYNEVKRVLKPSGILVFWGYSFFQTEGSLNELIVDFRKVIAPYWDKRRKLVDQHYASIKTPFNETLIPPMRIKKEISIKMLCEYLRTWSSVQHFKNINGFDPVDGLEAQINQKWDLNELISIEHPVFGKLCKPI